MKYYRKDFVPQGRSSGYCSLTIALGIMNYFFGTNFAAKDNFDLFGLIRWGRWERGDLLNMDEMALFLDRLYLDVTFFSSISQEDADMYMYGDKATKIAIITKNTNPALRHCIQGDKWVLENGHTIDLIDELVLERLQDSTVKYSNELPIEMVRTKILEHQDLKNGGVLFLLGLNRHILYEGEQPSNDGGGHWVLTTGITSNDEFEIYEPIYPRPNPHYIPVGRVLEAMNDLGSFGFMMIKDNPKHQD